MISVKLGHVQSLLFYPFLFSEVFICKMTFKEYLTLADTDTCCILFTKLWHIFCMNKFTSSLSWWYFENEPKLYMMANLIFWDKLGMPAKSFILLTVAMYATSSLWVWTRTTASTNLVVRYTGFVLYVCILLVFVNWCKLFTNVFCSVS